MAVTWLTIIASFCNTTRLMQDETFGEREQSVLS